MKKKIVISINAAWNIYNFRSGLVRALLDSGYEVIALAPQDEFSVKLQDMGCRFVPMPMDNKGVSPARDFALMLRYRKALKSIRPDVYLGYTIKPNVYGSLAAQSLGIATINNISGLGTAFIRKNLLTKIVQGLYRTALRRAHTVFFQNDDDRQEFVSSKLVRAEQTDLVPGSGIDLNAFATDSAAKSCNDQPGLTTFLMIARLVRDKGVLEYVEAARLVRQNHPTAKFSLLGFLGVANRTAIEKTDVDKWVAEGVIDYLGAAEDVRPYIRSADCVVLPSYREGTPRTLLESAAIGKPIITTDVPGCRETVDHGVNGFLCAVKDAEDLARQMVKFLGLSPKQRHEMGAAGRAKMERQFDEKLVIEKYLSAISQALNEPR